MTGDIIPILETLRTAGLSFVESNAGQKSENILHSVLANQVGTALTKHEDLADLINDSVEFSTSENRRFIRLADAGDGNRAISPLIYLDGDFSKKFPRFRIQLVVVTHSQRANDKPQCLLLRFETPEGTDPSGSGKHDYYHSQLCTNLRISGPNNTFSVPESISWLALSCPAWPLDAQTPVHLLACMIFAIYGKAEGIRMLRLAYKDELAKHLDGMHFLFGRPVAQASRKKKLSRKGRPKRSNRF